MTVRIKRKLQGEWLVLFVLTLPFFFFLFINVFQLSDAIKYLIDIAWVILLVLLVIGRKTLPNRSIKKVVAVIGCFVALTAIVYIASYQSILYYLWGMRNNLRFYVFLIACVMFLTKESSNAYFTFMDRLFFVNFIVTLFQFLFLHTRQDYLGGIFGIQKGCNGYTNIFILIVVIWHTLKYINGQESFGKCASRCLMGLLVAALAELKVFFVEFLLTVVLATLFTKFSARKLWIIVVAALGLFVALEVINQLFPHFANWFSMEGILKIIASRSGYTNSNDMNRLTFFSISMERFLDTWPRKLFGLGLGNCDYASGFDFLTTPFYSMHRNLHYTWLSSAFLLLETGIVGFGLYLWVFVQIYLGARQRQKKGLADPILCQMARIMAVMCPILVIYNSSLRTEAGYMVYFVLALPFLKKDGRTRSSAFDKGKEVANVEKG